MLVVVLFLASAIAALAAIISGRAVTETRAQRTLEQETRAYQAAYAQLQLALNVVNASPYDELNHNIELKLAMNGDYGGTAGGENNLDGWLADPTGILHGKIRGTDVRVYRGRDYVQRLAKLRGTSVPEVDPLGESDEYFVIEASGLSGSTTRMVSALVRENEPFSSFVFFQNRHPLGVSGAPRGLIHANDSIEFYFPNGSYEDPVSAVNGFTYEAGATVDNTNVADGNPDAVAINLEDADFTELKAQAGLFTGTAGLDAEVKMYENGQVRIKEFTRPRWDLVEYSYTYDELIGYETRTVTEQQQVQIGTTTETRTRTVQVGTTTETYYETVQVQVGTTTETRTRTVQTGTTTEERTRQVPIYDTRTVTKTRWVQVFVPYDDGSGGTAVGGGGDGVPGEWQWVQEEYEAEETYISGYTTETYTETVPVYGEETYTVDVPVYENQQVERTRDVPVYADETYEVEVPVYETQDVDVQQDFPIYETRTSTYSQWEHTPPALQDTVFVDIPENGGTMYIDGRITRLYGNLNGRLTIVANEKVRVTGDIKYMDDAGNTAMLNGNDYSQPYSRNPDYTGKSVLGVIARDDVLLTDSLPNSAEINGTLLSAFGRVGIDGFAITETGEPTKNWKYGMTAEEELIEWAYEYTSYDHDRFQKDSLRRLGGIVSNDRILETYIKSRSDGTSYVDSGFKRGRMMFDINLLFNPPPNFIEVPRPVVTSIAPIYVVRGDDGT
jgi:hypothetical protein